MKGDKRGDIRADIRGDTRGVEICKILKRVLKNYFMKLRILYRFSPPKKMVLHVFLQVIMNSHLCNPIQMKNKIVEMKG